MNTANILISKSEVLRYAGHRGQAIDDRISALVDAAISSCHRLARPKHIYRVFAIAQRASGLGLADTDTVLTGNDIAMHLRGAQQVALIAATLGVEIDNEIRRLEHTDITASLMLDAAATEGIEKYMNLVEETLRLEAEKDMLTLGTRFSPGYGDLPLTLQHDMLRLLDTSRRIGLTCLDSAIMLPRKSVTALVGLFFEPQQPRRSKCEACVWRTQCTFQQRSVNEPCSR